MCPNQGWTYRYDKTEEDEGYTNVELDTSDENVVFKADLMDTDFE